MRGLHQEHWHRCNLLAGDKDITGRCLEATRQTSESRLVVSVGSEHSDSSQRYISRCSVAGKKLAWITKLQDDDTCRRSYRLWTTGLAWTTADWFGLGLPARWRRAWAEELGVAWPVGPVGHSFRRRMDCWRRLQYVALSALGQWISDEDQSSDFGDKQAHMQGAQWS